MIIDELIISIIDLNIKDIKFFKRKRVFSNIIYLKNIITLSKSYNKKYYDLYIKYTNIYKLLKKYHLLHNQYEKDIEYYNGCTPLLYDILTTSIILPFTKSTYSIIEDYEKYINDIKDAIKYVPQCINFSYGFLRCRSNISPLYLACINCFVPINIVNEIYNLTESKEIIFNGKKINMIKDLKYNLSEKRYNDIKKIFNQ